jgi:hypothetical protein
MSNWKKNMITTQKIIEKDEKDINDLIDIFSSINLRDETISVSGVNIDQFKTNVEELTNQIVIPNTDDIELNEALDKLTILIKARVAVMKTFENVCDFFLFMLSKLFPLLSLCNNLRIQTWNYVSVILQIFLKTFLFLSSSWIGTIFLTIIYIYLQFFTSWGKYLFNIIINFIIVLYSISPDIGFERTLNIAYDYLMNTFRNMILGIGIQTILSQMITNSATQAATTAATTAATQAATEVISQQINSNFIQQQLIQALTDPRTGAGFAIAIANAPAMQEINKNIADGAQQTMQYLLDMTKTTQQTNAIANQVLQKTEFINENINIQQQELKSMLNTLFEISEKIEDAQQKNQIELLSQNSEFQNLLMNINNEYNDMNKQMIDLIKSNKFDNNLLQISNIFMDYVLKIYVNTIGNYVIKYLTNKPDYNRLYGGKRKHQNKITRKIRKMKKNKNKSKKSRKNKKTFRKYKK